METFLALDLGGTKLLIGEIDTAGNVLRHKRYASGSLDQREATELMVASLEDYIATVGWIDPAAPPVAMGAGLVGRVDAEGGMWLQIDPSRTHPTPLARILSERFSIPAFIDNDVKSAAQAVGRFEGAGDNYIYINVGTGLAAACVVNGTLIRGGHFNAGEVGHTSVGVNRGVVCGCGRSECVELIASGIGFDRCARLLAPHRETRLTIPAEPSRVDVREVFTLSREGDALCAELVENASQALAALVMNLVRVTDPVTVVLGGGILSDGYIYGRVMELLNPTTVRFVTGGVVLTGLNPDFIGLIGAGAVAMNKFKTRS
jgi:predicted NBD/HSP70 family sugar kinase